MTLPSSSRDSRSTRVRFVSNSTPTQTTGRLFRALADGVAKPTITSEVEFRQLPRGIWPKIADMRHAELRNIRRLRNCDTLVLHTPLAVSIVSIIAARILRKRVVAYVWDMHPESTRLIGTLKNPWVLAAYWIVERFALQLSSRIVVASTDYLPAVWFWRRKVTVVPLWPADEPSREPRSKNRDSQTLTVGFAGQINIIRGLEAGIDELLKFWTGSRVELHVFSTDEVPRTFLERASREPRLEVILRGGLEPHELQSALTQMDAGWVCLDPSFSLPAFPSKSMSYISAGVPVLYTGPQMPGFESWLESNALGIVTRATTIEPSEFTDLAAKLPTRRDAYFSRMQRVWYAM